MADNETRRLLQDLAADPALALELERIEDLETGHRWACDRGYTLKIEEIEEILASREELSDDDLEKVAGGWEGSDPPPDGSGG